MKRKLIYFNLGLITLLIALIILIKTGIINSFDQIIYNFITQDISITKTHFFKFITFFGSTTFIISITIFFLLIFRKNRYGKEFLIIICFSMLLSSILKVIVARERPEVLKLAFENTYSFPSGHTMAITVLCGYLIFLIWKEWGSSKIFEKVLITLLGGIIAILVMISRIYLGVHFASDIIGGLICSLFTLNLSLYFLENKFFK